MRRCLCLVALLAAVLSPAARAADDVDVALVLVSDVSRSIDDSEFKLEKDGYLTAFTSSAVIDAIRSGLNGAIGVAYVEFASSFEVRTVIDWTVIRDKASAQAFAENLAAAPRSFWGRTAISAGVDSGVQLLAESGLNAPRRVIDVCGDGTNNAGREITEARDDALKAGITINGLAIINDHPVSWTFAHVQPPGGLANYYRENVTGGPGSFVLEVHDFHTFGEAMTRKLISEIASRVPATRFAGGP
jgi:opacity protein-like surface antigen